MIYINDYLADLLLFGVTLFVLLFVVGIWLRQRTLSKTIIVLVILCVPLTAAVLLLVPPAYRGLPDVNCPKYGNGKMVFILEEVSVRPKTLTDPYGQALLVLLVRSPERWGDNLHLCTIPSNSEKAKDVMNFLSEYGFEPGVTTIVFGGEQERPNVTWGPKELLRFEKPGPPEIPSN